MTRYWITLGPVVDNTRDKVMISMQNELEKISNRTDVCPRIFGSSTCYQFVTEDLIEAKKVYAQAVAIYKKYDLEGMTDGIDIHTQPECPKCHTLGRFSDVFCSQCGTELIPAESISPTE